MIVVRLQWSARLSLWLRGVRLGGGGGEEGKGGGGARRGRGVTTKAAQV